MCHLSPQHNFIRKGHLELPCFSLRRGSRATVEQTCGRWVRGVSPWLHLWCGKPTRLGVRKIKFQSWPCPSLAPPSAFELAPTPTPGHTFRSMAVATPGRALESKLICLVSKGLSQSDPTLPTQPCFPWFPNSSLGFKPSGLLMVPWGNIPGSFTEFLRPAMPLLLCFA